MSSIKIRFLGTGTSTGVPQIGCNCRVCRSADDKDKRLRTSAIISVEDSNILIDCGPDFRTQMLNCGSPDLSGVLLTHTHYDHVGGIDDLRPYCNKTKNFPIYCQQDVAQDLRERLPYCFVENPYPGVPIFKIHEIGSESFYIDKIKIEPLKIFHHKLEILGFKIGNMAYITDAKTIPKETIYKIKNIDTLVINALRINDHLSHMSLSQALEVIKIINPRVSYLIHLSHDMGLHTDVQKLLPQDIHIAYDGLEILVN